MLKKWNVKIDGRGLDQYEIIDAILENRGIEDIGTFLHPTEDDLIPYEKFKNIDIAADIVLNTINSGGTFMVYYDTDQDGQAAGSIATRYLKNYTDNIRVYCNEGKQHGLSNFSLDNLDGVDTLWIVDSIDDNPTLYQKILDKNIRILITDHHMIPEAIKNIDICLISSANDYPNPALSGSATTWKLCKYIDYLTLNDYADELVDLSCIGLIADMCSVGMDSPENRYICYEGFNHSNNLGIKQINGSYEFNSKAVSFGIAPLINSANRVNDNQTAVKLFLSDDKKEVNQLIKQLKADKEKQNEEVMALMPGLMEQYERQIGQKCMYFFLEDTDSDITGLVGNRMLEIAKVPLFIFSKEKDGQYVGSMRAIGVSDFSKVVGDTGLGYCRGHELAAGCFIDIATFDKFKQKIEEALSEIEFKVETDVDIQLNTEQITESLIKQLKMINKISGSGFRPVNVMVSDIKDYTVGHMSNGKHLRIDTAYLAFIKWNCGEEVENGKELSAIGELDLSWFGRRLTKQMIMSDFKTE